jgi:hypothetical protein
MTEGMHVFSRRVLQLTNESSMMGGTFKYKEKKTWSTLLYVNHLKHSDKTSKYIWITPYMCEYPSYGIFLCLLFKSERYLRC